MFRYKFILALLCLLAGITGVNAGQQDKMMQTMPSLYSYETTRQRLLDGIHDNNLKLFAELDHAAAAKESGLTMPPTTVLVFGNPKAGTPMMLAHPSLALDLPFRVLIAETTDGKVLVSYPDAATFARHDLTPDELAVMAKLPVFVKKTLQQ